MSPREGPWQPQDREWRFWRVLAVLVLSVGSCGHRESSVSPPSRPVQPPPVPTSFASAVPDETEEAQKGPAEKDRECDATINARVDRVRGALTDYDHYATILPKFGRSRIIRKSSQGTDVYLQVPILSGAANLWAVVRFVGPTSVGDGERIEGKYLGEGNVSAFHCLWIYRRIDDLHTALHLAILLLPPMPLPGSVIDKELTDACRDALGGVKSYTEAPPP
jgi:hypothetical protein